MNTTSTPLILIGASTGGPGVLKIILEKLPKTFSATIIIAQHIHQEFLPGLAEWLTSISGHTVKIPQGGEVVSSGAIYIAGTKGNLFITAQNTFSYLPAPKTQSYIPSIDTVFQECSKGRCRGAAFLLSGMGDDGSVGLQELSKSGWRTYVQKRSTCAVDGMPSAALSLNAQHDEKNPEQIAALIFNLAIAKPEVLCQRV